MTSPAALLSILLFFGFDSPQIGEGCIATSSTGMPVTSSTAAPTTVSVTTTPTTASVTTTTPTTTTMTTTTTTTTVAPNCSTCPMDALMQAPRTPVSNGIDGVMAVITYSIQGGCIVPNIVCNTVGGLPYVITIAIKENEGLLFGGGCATTAMPPGIVVCNAMGQWISTVTNNIQPQIACLQANPATEPAC